MTSWFTGVGPISCLIHPLLFKICLCVLGNTTGRFNSFMSGFCQRDNITNFTIRPPRPQRGVYVSDLCGLCVLCVLCGESVPCAPKRIYSFQWKNGFSASYWSANRRLEDLVSCSNDGLISCFSTGCAIRKWFNRRFRRGWRSTLMREWLGSELCRFA